MMDLLTTEILITVGAIIVLIFFSAFFSGSESALTSSSEARMLRLEQQGSAQAKRVRGLIKNKDRLISGLLLGNNLVNILASALATSLFITLFPNNGVAYATVIMTLLVLVFAEVLPKTYALRYPDDVSLWVSRPIAFCVAIFAPFAVSVSRFVSLVISLIDRGHDRRTKMHAHDEIRGAIDLAHEAGDFVKQDKDMLGGVLDLKELAIADIMVHRTNMRALDISLPPQEIANAVLDSPFTRMPLYDGDPENIIGVLHTRDMLRALVRVGSDVSKLNIRELAIEPWFVPESTPVTSQLREILKRQAHMMFVVDEYGEVMGLATLEDILEEIVGDISDEHDAARTGVVRQADGSYIVEGTLPIRDLNRACDWDLPDEEVNTIAGLIIHESKTIPNQGQSFQFYGFRFQILRKNRNRLSSIRITPTML